MAGVSTYLHYNYYGFADDSVLGYTVLVTPSPPCGPFSSNNHPVQPYTPNYKSDVYKEVLKPAKKAAKSTPTHPNQRGRREDDRLAVSKGFLVPVISTEFCPSAAGVSKVTDVSIHTCPDFYVSICLFTRLRVIPGLHTVTYQILELDIEPDAERFHVTAP
jgi:hypothetical protein